MVDIKKEINTLLSEFLSGDIDKGKALNRLVGLSESNFRYFINENGELLKGTIKGLTKRGLEVHWSDGKITYETSIDPTVKHITIP